MINQSFFWKFLFCNFEHKLILFTSTVMKMKNLLICLPLIIAFAACKNKEEKPPELLLKSESQQIEAVSFEEISEEKRFGLNQNIDSLNGAIINDPSNPELYFNRGVAKSELQRHEDAIFDFSKAIELDPLPTFFLFRGFSKAEINDQSGALDDFNKSIELYPMEPSAYYNRGLVKINMEDYSGAVLDFTQTLAIDPTRAEAYYNRGLSKAKQGDYEDAILDYDQAIEIHASSAEAYYNRGFAKVNLQQFNEAIHDFTTAIDLNPEFVEAYNNLGLSHIMLGDNQQGCAYLQKAYELGFENAFNAMNVYCK